MEGFFICGGPFRAIVSLRQVRLQRQGELWTAASSRILSDGVANPSLWRRATRTPSRRLLGTREGRAGNWIRPTPDAASADALRTADRERSESCGGEERTRLSDVRYISLYPGQGLWCQKGWWPIHKQSVEGFIALFLGHDGYWSPGGTENTSVQIWLSFQHPSAWLRLSVSVFVKLLSPPCSKCHWKTKRFVSNWRGKASPVWSRLSECENPPSGRGRECFLNHCGLLVQGKELIKPIVRLACRAACRRNEQRQLLPMIGELTADKQRWEPSPCSLIHFQIVTSQLGNFFSAVSFIIKPQRVVDGLRCPQHLPLGFCSTIHQSGETEVVSKTASEKGPEQICFHLLVLCCQKKWSCQLLRSLCLYQFSKPTDITLQKSLLTVQNSWFHSKREDSISGVRKQTRTDEPIPTWMSNLARLTNFSLRRRTFLLIQRDSIHKL